MVMYSCGAGRRPAYEENAETNHRDSKPAQRGNRLSEKKVTKEGDREIGQGCGRLHITIVCPS